MEWLRPASNSNAGEQAAFAGFGGVQRDASAGGFQFVQPFPVRREKRPADQGERNLMLPARPAAAAKRSRPNEIAPRLRQIRAAKLAGADSSKRVRVRLDRNISRRNSSGDGAWPPMARRNCPSRSSSERKICPAAAVCQVAGRLNKKARRCPPRTSRRQSRAAFGRRRWKKSRRNPSAPRQTGRRPPQRRRRRRKAATGRAGNLPLTRCRAAAGRAPGSIRRESTGW